MLFMMGAARHLAPTVGEGANLLYVALIVGGIALLLEINALFGKQGRSEEHTSELQSRSDLVFPLLLSKITKK